MDASERERERDGEELLESFDGQACESSENFVAAAAGFTLQERNVVGNHYIGGWRFRICG